MGFRKVIIRRSAAESIASIAWYLESEGLLATAEKFSDDLYDFINKLGIAEKVIGYAEIRKGTYWDISVSLIRKNTQSYLLNWMQRSSSVNLSLQREFIGKYRSLFTTYQLPLKNRLLQTG